MFTKNQYRRGEDCLKRGGLGQFADLRGGTWQEREGWCFWGGGDTPVHTMVMLIEVRRFIKAYCCDSKWISEMPRI